MQRHILPMVNSIGRFRVIAATIVVILTLSLVWLSMLGAANQPLSHGLIDLMHHPWGLATLCDLAAGLLLTATWMCVVEARPRRLWLWLPLLACLGNIATGIFLLARLRRAGNLQAWLTHQL